MYIYTIREGYAKVKNNTKTYLAAGITTLVMIGGIVAPTLAVKPAVTPAAAPKATGSIGWINSGAQAYDEFNAQMTSTTCTTKWDVTGVWKLNYALTDGGYDSNLYDVTLSQAGSTLSGIGQYPSPGPYAYAWTVNGSISGNTVNLTDTYTLGAIGTTMHMNGTIAPNGTMTGTWNDDYTVEGRTGTWVSTLGAAVQVADSGCTGKGNFTYSDSNGINYVMDVKYVNVKDKDTWFAGPTTSGNFGIGTWILIRVTDNGEPGVGNDQIWGEAVANETVAKNSVAGMVNPAGGPFTLTSGNLQVHKN